MAVIREVNSGCIYMGILFTSRKPSLTAAALRAKRRVASTYGFLLLLGEDEESSAVGCWGSVVTS